jgi:HAD superfamily hydrolase (TIGR01459 family)
MIPGRDPGAISTASDRNAEEDMIEIAQHGRRGATGESEELRMADTSAPPQVEARLADLVGDYDLIFCDVWGVVHNGVRRHVGAVDALQRFRRAGGAVILITNAPVPSEQVRRRLDSLHVERDAYDDIATSGDVTIDLIREAGCPPLFGIGPTAEVALYAEAGYSDPGGPRLVGLDEAELAVCIGLDDTGILPADYDGILSTLRDRDLRLICANPDIVVEVGDELVYCAGAIAARYAAMGGSVTQAGKPFQLIYERAIRLAAAVSGIAPRARTLVIGDGIATDIRGAENQGFASLFISGSIHRAELHPGGRDSPVDAVALTALLSKEGVRPRAVASSLRWT